MNDEQYEKRLADRFQNQPWYIRLWRLRWYLVIPFYAFVYRFLFAWSNPNTGEKEYNTLREAWALGESRAQEKMDWFYTLKEMDIYLNVNVANSSSTKRTSKKK